MKNQMPDKEIWFIMGFLVIVFLGIGLGYKDRHQAIALKSETSQDKMVIAEEPAEPGAEDVAGEADDPLMVRVAIEAEQSDDQELAEEIDTDLSRGMTPDDEEQQDTEDFEDDTGDSDTSIATVTGVESLGESDENPSDLLNEIRALVETAADDENAVEEDATSSEAEASLEPSDERDSGVAAITEDPESDKPEEFISADLSADEFPADEISVDRSPPDAGKQYSRPDVSFSFSRPEANRKEEFLRLKENMKRRYYEILSEEMNSRDSSREGLDEGIKPLSFENPVFPLEDRFNPDTMTVCSVFNLHYMCDLRWFTDQDHDHNTLVLSRSPKIEMSFFQIDLELPFLSRLNKRFFQAQDWYSGEIHLRPEMIVGKPAIVLEGFSSTEENTARIDYYFHSDARVRAMSFMLDSRHAKDEAKAFVSAFVDSMRFL